MTIKIDLELSKGVQEITSKGGGIYSVDISLTLLGVDASGIKGNILRDSNKFLYLINWDNGRISYSIQDSYSEIGKKGKKTLIAFFEPLVPCAQNGELESRDTYSTRILKRIGGKNVSQAMTSVIYDPIRDIADKAK